MVANSQQEKWEAVYGASLSGKKSLMFAEAEIVDFVSRSGKTRTLKETIQNKLMPSLRVQPGFVDEIILESDVEPNRVLAFLALSFWKTREQAERYGQETYPAVKEVLLVSLETDPPGENLQRGKLTTSQHDSGQGGLVQPEKSLDEPVTGQAVVLRQSAPSTNGAFKYPTTGHKACFGGFSSVPEYISQRRARMKPSARTCTQGAGTGWRNSCELT